MKNVTLGIFDSGIGGIAVLERLQKSGFSSFLYLADKGYMPYGSKTRPQIAERALSNVRFLTQRGADAVVIGCNTASLCLFPDCSPSYCYDFTQICTKIIPTLPPLQHAIARGYKKILVLATPLSIRLIEATKTYQSNFDRFILKELDFLASDVERNFTRKHEIEDKVFDALNPYNNGVDCVILGCTHYCYLHSFFCKLFPSAAILDGADRAVSCAIKTFGNVTQSRRSTVKFLTRDD